MQERETDRGRDPTPRSATARRLARARCDDRRPPTATRPRTPREFIGDSTVAGDCNLCPPGTVDENVTRRLGVGAAGAVDDQERRRLLVSSTAGAESYFYSWPNRVCDALGTECSSIVWSGLGLLTNWAGGGDLHAPQVYRQTLSTDWDTRWDFQSWVPDALVINLGADGAWNGTIADPPRFVATLLAMARNASIEYGDGLRCFSSACSAINRARQWRGASRRSAAV